MNFGHSIHALYRGDTLKGEKWPPARRYVGWETHGNDFLLWGGSGIAKTNDGGYRHTFINDFWSFSPVTEF